MFFEEAAWESDDVTNKLAEGLCQKFTLPKKTAKKLKKAVKKDRKHEKTESNSEFKLVRQKDLRRKSGDLHNDVEYEKRKKGGTNIKKMKRLEQAQSDVTSSLLVKKKKKKKKQNLKLSAVTESVVTVKSKRKKNRNEGDMDVTVKSMSFASTQQNKKSKRNKYLNMVSVDKIVGKDLKSEKPILDIPRKVKFTGVTERNLDRSQVQTIIDKMAQNKGNSRKKVKPNNNNITSNPGENVNTSEIKHKKSKASNKRKHHSSESETLELNNVSTDERDEETVKKKMRKNQLKDDKLEKAQIKSTKKRKLGSVQSESAKGTSLINDKYSPKMKKNTKNKLNNEEKSENEQNKTAKRKKLGTTQNEVQNSGINSEKESPKMNNKGHVWSNDKSKLVSNIKSDQTFRESWSEAEMPGLKQKKNIIKQNKYTDRDEKKHEILNNKSDKNVSCDQKADKEYKKQHSSSLGGAHISKSPFDVKTLKKILSSENTSESMGSAVQEETSKQQKMQRKMKKPTSLKEKLQSRLSAARFRYLNEQLYTCTGEEAYSLFQQDPDAFQCYHEGFQEQVTRWPANPLDKMIECIRAKPSSLVVADFGCGDAQLAQSVKNKVHSFDLVAINQYVTACDIRCVPLQNNSVDVVVFCLSLMGTNFIEYLCEANRVLKYGGILLIAEVVSRFGKVGRFARKVEKLGFSLENKDQSNKMFLWFEFKKTGKPPVEDKLPCIDLAPCVYKKR